MALNKKQEPDFGLSIPFRTERSLHPKFVPLRQWFAGQLFRFHKLGIPKARVIDKIETAIDCVLANLLAAYRTSPTCFVAISRGEARYVRSRYVAADFGYTNLIRVLDFLEQNKPAYVGFKRGFHDRRGPKAIGKVSRYAASSHLVDLIVGYLNVIDQYLERGIINVNDVLQDAQAFAEAHPALLKAPLPADCVFAGESPELIRLKNMQGTLVDYDDDEVTTGMRERLVGWNRFLHQNHIVDLLLPDDEIESIFQPKVAAQEEDPFFGDEHDESPRFVELDRTELYRVFNNNSFHHGGRFYGGWWQTIPSRYRRFITINEHATKEYDYSNLHAAILYAKEGLPLVEDAYTLPGIPNEHRKLIKTTFMKLINALPNQPIEPPKKNALPHQMTWAELQRAVIEKHEPIRKYLRTGIGLELQALDSEIAERVMLQLMQDDILALPVHDSFITYHELSKKLQDAMQTTYRERMNAEIGVDPDLSFIEEFAKDFAEGAAPADYDIIAHIQGAVGYDGYRRRHHSFRRTRSDEWHRRFSG